jgi:hypothetical protein
MTLDELKASIAGDEPPSLQPATIQALWHDARGDWDRAHQHRKEGDLANASYWYRRAGRIRPSAPLSEEWAHIAETLLR